MDCNNVVTATGEAKVSCCGRKLLPLVTKKADEEHRLNIEIIEDEFYITFDHEMSKSHYISFIAYVDCDRILLIKLYPEQSGEIRFPRMNGRKFYFYCNRHGLWFHG